MGISFSGAGGLVFSGTGGKLSLAEMIQGALNAAYSFFPSAGLLGTSTSYARAGEATIIDHLGRIQVVQPNELRVCGMHRIYNLLPNTHIANVWGGSNTPAIKTLSATGVTNVTAFSANLSDNNSSNHMGTQYTTDPLVTGKQYTVSFYIYKDTSAQSSFPLIQIYDTATTYTKFSIFVDTYTGDIVDLHSTGVSGRSPCDSKKIETATSVWWRVSYTFTPRRAGPHTLQLYPAATLDKVALNTNATGSHRFAAPQVEEGALASEFVSRGELSSSPYHGFGADGVKYVTGFDEGSGIINQVGIEGADSEAIGSWLNGVSNLGSYTATVATTSVAPPTSIAGSAVVQVSDTSTSYGQSRAPFRETTAIANGTTICFSIYIKKTSGDANRSCIVITHGTVDYYYILDTNTGAQGGQYMFPDDVQLVEDVDSVWWRWSVKTVTTQGTMSIAFYPTKTTSMVDSNAGGNSLTGSRHVCAPMLEFGVSVPSAYLSTGDTTSSLSYAPYDYTKEYAKDANGRIVATGNVLDIPNYVSVLVEPARTNLFINSEDPVTQTISVSTGTDYTIRYQGAGTVSLSGAMTGTAIEDVAFTRTATTTSLTVTVSGVVDRVQVEHGRFSTSFIVTNGSAVTRSDDQLIGTLDTDTVKYPNLSIAMGFKLLNGEANANNGSLFHIGDSAGDSRSIGVTGDTWGIDTNSNVTVNPVVIGTAQPSNLMYTRRSGRQDVYANEELIATASNSLVDDFYGDWGTVTIGSAPAGVPGMHLYGFVFYDNNILVDQQAITDQKTPTLDPTYLGNTKVYADGSPYWKYVSFAMQGSTDLVDYKGRPVAVQGNININTGSSKFGSSSMYFDGSSDYLHYGTMGTTQYALFQQLFTCEAWFNKIDNSTVCLFDTRYSISQSGVLVRVTDTTLRMVVGSTTVVGSTQINLNTWNHIAVVRSEGSVFTMYLNGVNVGSTTQPAFYADTHGAFEVGAATNGSESFKGYMQDIRLHVGIAKYTGAFTPLDSLMWIPEV